MDLTKIMAAKRSPLYDRSKEALAIIPEMDGCPVDPEEFRVLSPRGAPLPSGDHGHTAVATITDGEETFNLFADVVLPQKMLAGAKLPKIAGAIWVIRVREFEGGDGQKQYRASLRAQAMAA